MDYTNTPSPETPRDPVEIRSENEITISEALHLAAEAALPLGLSTLQRWAKHWAHQGAEARVKTILVTIRQGKVYKLDRDDFKAWVFDQKQNTRPQETLSDSESPHEVSQDLGRSRETSRDPVRPRETSGGADDNDRLHDLQSENMDLKIDLGVRKQLLERAREEMDTLRGMADSLLRENGALQFQIRQLAAPKPKAAEIDQANIAQHQTAEPYHATPIDPDATVE